VGKLHLRELLSLYFLGKTVREFQSDEMYFAAGTHEALEFLSKLSWDKTTWSSD